MDSIGKEADEKSPFSGTSPVDPSDEASPRKRKVAAPVPPEISNCLRCRTPDENYWRHLREEHKIEVDIFREICQFCGVRFLFISQVQRHRVSAHPPGSEFDCPQCGCQNISFEALSEHLEKDRESCHSGLVECIICGVFVIQTALSLHVHRHLKLVEMKGSEMTPPQRPLDKPLLAASPNNPNPYKQHGGHKMNVGILTKRKPQDYLHGVTSLPIAIQVVKEPFPTKTSPLVDCVAFHYGLQLSEAVIVKSQHGTNLEWILEPPPVLPQTNK